MYEKHTFLENIHFVISLNEKKIHNELWIKLWFGSKRKSKYCQIRDFCDISNLIYSHHRQLPIAHGNVTKITKLMCAI